MGNTIIIDTVTKENRWCAYHYYDFWTESSNTVLHALNVFYSNKYPESKQQEKILQALDQEISGIESHIEKHMKEHYPGKRSGLQSILQKNAEGFYNMYMQLPAHVRQAVLLAARHKILERGI